jgi:hypothetical protein
MTNLLTDLHFTFVAFIWYKTFLALQSSLSCLQKVNPFVNLYLLYIQLVAQKANSLLQWFYIVVDVRLSHHAFYTQQHIGTAQTHKAALVKRVFCAWLFGNTLFYWTVAFGKQIPCWRRDMLDWMFERLWYCFSLLALQSVMALIGEMARLVRSVFEVPRTQLTHFFDFIKLRKQFLL